MINSRTQQGSVSILSAIFLSAFVGLIATIFYLRMLHLTVHRGQNLATNAALAAASVLDGQTNALTNANTMVSTIVAASESGSFIATSQFYTAQLTALATTDSDATAIEVSVHKVGDSKIFSAKAKRVNCTQQQPCGDTGYHVELYS